MLSRLAIRNIVLIEALELDFSRGLGVLTGETGAGQSILLDALGLILGYRADSALVRTRRVLLPALNLRSFRPRFLPCYQRPRSRWNPASR